LVKKLCKIKAVSTKFHLRYDNPSKLCAARERILNICCKIYKKPLAILGKVGYNTSRVD